VVPVAARRAGRRQALVGGERVGVHVAHVVVQVLGGVRHAGAEDDVVGVLVQALVAAAVGDEHAPRPVTGHPRPLRARDLADVDEVRGEGAALALAAAVTAVVAPAVVTAVVVAVARVSAARVAGLAGALAERAGGEGVEAGGAVGDAADG